MSHVDAPMRQPRHESARAAAKTDVLWIGGIWIVLGAIGEFLANYVLDNWYPKMVALQGDVTAAAFAFLLRVDVLGVILISTILVYTAIRFRAADDALTPSAWQYRYGRLFAWGWLGTSLTLNVLFIFYPGVTGLITLWTYRNDAQHPLVVNVEAKQWEWRFSYPQYSVGNQTELVLPADSQIKFVLRSDDVIHAFWVPAFGVQESVIPGETRTLAINTKSVVTSTTVDPLVRVQCVQICGVGHADMRAAVKIVSRNDFKQWLAQNSGSMSGMGSTPGLPWAMSALLPRAATDPRLSDTRNGGA